MAELQSSLEDANVHLRGTDNDGKVSSLHALEQQIRASLGDLDLEALPVYEQIVAPLKVALKNGNSHIYGAGLSCTLALFTALEELAKHQQQQQHPTSKQHHQLETIVYNAVNMLAPAPGGLITFLGDAKESIRVTARAALTTAGKVCVAILGTDSSKIAPETSALAILDKLVKEHGFGSKSGKTREQSMLYIVELREACPSLPLRSWMPILVNALEDSDPSVRDTVREGVISIFAAPTVGAAARADLKKELQKKAIRKHTADTILKRVLGGSAPRSSSGSIIGSPPSGSGSIGSEVHSTGRRTPSMTSMHPPRPSSSISIGRSPSSTSLPQSSTGGSSATSKPAAPKGDRLLKQPKNMTQEEILASIEAVAAANAPPPSSGENNIVEVVYVASAKDLDNEVNALLPAFSGKETEFNWQDRERAIYRIRGMLKGNVHHTYRAAFIASLRTLVEGILKAVNSLRTTLASAGCSLATELAESLRDGLLPVYETMLSGLLKLASLTKKQIAQASQDAVTAMLRNCHFHHKTLPLLANTFEQKNTQARSYVAKHVLVFVEVQAALHKDAIEAATGGTSLLFGLLSKEFADPNAAVRDAGRAAFWVVHSIWTQQAQALLDSLDATTRKALEKSGLQSKNHAPSLGDRSASTSNIAAKGRPSMRELISLKRAATSVGNSLSASVPASASSARTSQETHQSNPLNPVDSERSKRSSISTAPPTRSATSPTTVPRARPASFYGSRAVSSHIPSPPRPYPTTHADLSSNIRPRDDRRSSQLHQSSLPDPSLTPTRGMTAISTNAHAPPHIPSSPSDSPPLRPPSYNPEISDIEDSTFNAMPHGLDSSEDDSMNLLNYHPPKGSAEVSSRRDFDISERSRILDGLMDVSFDIEVEEAVKGHAEQAEQTAHRFLELTEPDDDRESDFADQTIVIQAEALEEDIPVPYTPNGRSYAPSGDNTNELAKTLARPAHDISTTPVVQKFLSLSLQDSPAVSRVEEMKRLPLLSVIQDSWWLAKADRKPAIQLVRRPLLTIIVVCLSKLPPPALSDIQKQDVETQIASLEDAGPSLRTFVNLAHMSKATDCRDTIDTSVRSHVWDANLVDRTLSVAQSTLRTQQGEEKAFGSLLLLFHITRYQYPLLDGRETEILDFLFSVTAEPDKNLRAGVEVVVLGMLQEAEPLYGLSCLRWSMQRLAVHDEANGQDEAALEGRYTPAYTIGFKAMATLLKGLPAEVLEEEIVRCRDLIKLGLNSKAAALRQGATTVIVEVHEVIEDDARLFDLLDGLTKAQVNLCTYLFARRGSMG